MPNKQIEKDNRPADPGIGSRRAEIGSKAWAEFVRLSSTPIIENAQRYPKDAKGYVDLIIKHRAWTMLNKRDGSTFATIQEFCEYEKPWGWATPWPKLAKVLELACDVGQEIGARVVALGTVAPDHPQDRADNGTFVEKQPRGHNGPADPERTEKRLRAIATRAPEPIRDLFRKDLIGVTDAAALGPVARETDPDVAAKVASATSAAVAVVEAAAIPKSKSDRSAIKRQVNAVVRETLGASKPDPVASILALVRKLSDVDKGRLALDLPSVGVVTPRAESRTLEGGH